ncbi:MAG: hypothetical protein FWC01_00650 [Treponema sp.]|nr:hypothetical protein [Treponema sp.]MCL2236621.1 hypothetical protein [Treponema sp.]
MQNEKERTGIGDKINDFVQKNRTGIFVAIGILAVAFLGFVAYYAISESVNRRDIAAVEDLNKKFIDLNELIEAGETSDEIEELLAELKDFGSKTKGFSGGKALSLAAQIYTYRKEWQPAKELWQEAARVGSKTYIGPIALFQAAAVSEEMEEYEEAIELYKQCIAHKFEFPAAPRAQLSIGRLYEKLEDYPSATESYRAVLSNWPQMDNWQNIARSRIIAIEVR